jgi:hypothetical protein
LDSRAKRASIEPVQRAYPELTIWTSRSSFASVPRVLRRAVRTANGPVSRAILSGPIRRKSLVSERGWGVGLRTGVLFVGAVTGSGGVVRGVAVTLAYVVAIGARGGVAVGVGGAFDLVGEGDLGLGRMPLI